MTSSQRIVLSVGSTILLVAAASACGGSTGPYSPVRSNQSTANASTENASVVAWSRNLTDLPLPAAGCFEAQYPAVDWVKVSCSESNDTSSVAPADEAIDAADGSGGHGGKIGGTVKLEASPYYISKAIGSFQNASVTSVSTLSGARKGLNSYSIQLNPHGYPSSACGAGAPTCRGWEQFVFTNLGPGMTGHLGIQDWLYYAKSCPAYGGWTPKPGKDGKVTCESKHRSANVPNTPIAMLGDMSMTAVASPKGDTVYLRVGTKMYGVKKTQRDGLTDLSKHWQTTEFDVFGDANSSQAAFNQGASYTVTLQADTGHSSKPVCTRTKSSTGESSNLSYVVAPTNAPMLQYPSIIYSESNAMPNPKHWHCYGIPAK